MLFLLLAQLWVFLCTVWPFQVILNTDISEIPSLKKMQESSQTPSLYDTVDKLPLRHFETALPNSIRAPLLLLIEKEEGISNRLHCTYYKHAHTHTYDDHRFARLSSAKSKGIGEEEQEDEEREKKSSNSTSLAKDGSSSYMIENWSKHCCCCCCCCWWWYMVREEQAASNK